MKNILILISAFMIISAHCISQSQGPYNSSSSSYSAAGCLACPGSDWYNFQNVSLPDHQYADAVLAVYPQCFQATCYYSRILYAFDFGFTVPQGATILGVSASVLRFSTSATGVSDSLVQLYTGNPVGTNHASPTNWTPNPVNVLYGDSSDTWGYPLTPDSVNSTLFGLALMAVNRNMTGTMTTASIDHIEMTVYFNTGTGVQLQTRTGSNFSIHYNSSNSTLDIISWTLKINSILITDNLGHQIFKSEQPLAAVQSKLTLPQLQKGIYFVVAEFDGKMAAKKFTVE